VLFNSKYCLGLFCFYVGYSSLHGSPHVLSLGRRFLHWEVPTGTKDDVLSNDFPNKWGRVLEVVSSRGTPS
jgi:hypothetical protein